VGKVKIEYHDPATIDKMRAGIGAIVSDPAALDTPQDEIQEIMLKYGGISKEAAERLYQWHLARTSENPTDKEVSRLRKIISIFASGMTKTKFWGLMYAADITELIGNKTMTQMAAKLCVGKQAISKEANKWKDELELPQSKSMRAEEAQGHFRAAACRQHGMSVK
jgi:hypothetical protein